MVDTSVPAPRRRRRRWPWVVLAVAALLVVGLVVGDRLAHSYAEDAVAEQLGGQAPFTSAPRVTLDGFPFLTQAVRGDYEHVTVDGSGLTLGDLHGVTFHADLRGVHVPLSDVLGGTVRSVPVDTADGRVVIPYAEFARQTGIDGLTITEDAGTLTVTAPVRVEVAFFDKTFDVVARGTIAASGGNDLVLSVDQIKVAGVSLPGFAVDFIEDQLNARVKLPALPYGLRLQSVSPRSDGLHVAVSGRDLTIDGS
ncbi:LmeA family phospholipid-binding protein [Jatrophihabitans sp. YIM 134969]